MAVDVAALQADNAHLSARATSLVSEIEGYKKDLKKVVVAEKALAESLVELDSLTLAYDALKQQFGAQLVECNALKGQVASLKPRAVVCDQIVAAVKAAL